MSAWLLAGAAAAGPPVAARADLGLAAGFGDIGHDRDSWRGNPAFRYGYDRGWRQGSEEGHRDARRWRAPRCRCDAGSRESDRGYSRWMGRRGDYLAGFRRGCEAGYRRAFAAARPGWRE